MKLQISSSILRRARSLPKSRVSNSEIATLVWCRARGCVLGPRAVELSHYWQEHNLHGVETREEHELLTGGPYRWVRHPLYTVGTSFFVSLSLLAANWFMGLASLVVLVMLSIRLPKEEEKLIERFGDEYRAYMKRTGRLLPRLERDQTGSRGSRSG